MSKTFSREEVEAHNKAEDLWIVIHNKVYDVSAYREDHPGGHEIFVDVAGMDATQSFEDVGHSDDARDSLEPLLIGELKEDEAHEVVQTYRPTFETVSTVNDLRTTKRGVSALSAFTIASVVLLGTGTAMRFVKTPISFPTISYIKSVAHVPAGVTFISGGFWKGFFAATVINGTMAILGFQYLEKLLDVSTDFRKYAARKIAPVEIHGPRKVLVEPVLHPQQYRKFPLVRKDKLSSNVYRFIFRLPKQRDVLGLPTGQHVAIRAEIDGKLVARSYTPTSNNTDFGRFELVVKVYPGGLISNYLAGLQPNDLVEFRGPKGAMKYHRNLCKSLGMIAGGTGITPMYQLIRAICEDPTDNTQVSLLYGNQTESDILLREELDSFQRAYPNKFSVWYVVGSAPEGWQYGVGHINSDMIKEKLFAPSPDCKVHLCGPPIMMKIMKEILIGSGFDSPGSISKMNDQIFVY